MERMTIHRALSELKLLDARILKGIEGLIPVGLYQEGKLINGFHTAEEFTKNCIGSYQGIQDLISRKERIKSAIVMSNSVTRVVVAGRDMTVSDAITQKTVVELRKKLISDIQKKYNLLKGKFFTDNEKINATALENAKIVIGRQGDTSVKPTDKDVVAIVEPFVKRNEWKMIDPLGVEKLLVDLDKEVSGFESEVDAVLSESNSVTFIEI